MKVRVSTCFAVAGFFLLTASAFAQATRTWVSGVGDDANPCSRTAPCKTLAGAISKTASAGIIDALDPGGFGALTITKPITIEGNGTLLSVLSSGTNGIVINITGAQGTGRDVILRHVLIDGTGTTLGTNGIRFLAGDLLVVEDSYVKSYSQNCVDFEPNSFAHLAVRNTLIAMCGNASSGAAILIKPAAGGNARASIENSEMRNSYTGLRVEDNSVVTVFRSSATGNTTSGFLAFSNSSPLDLMIDSSEASLNSGNGVATTGANAYARISNCVIHGNSTGVNQSSGHIYSFLNNTIFGNGFDGTPVPNTAQQQ